MKILILSVVLGMCILLSMVGASIVAVEEQIIDGTTVTISVNDLHFGGIFNGQSIPMSTVFTVAPGTAVEGFKLNIVAIDIAGLVDLDEGNVMFSKDNIEEYTNDQAAFITAHAPLLLVNDPEKTLFVKLSGVAADPGTPVSATITYTIASPFAP